MQSVDVVALKKRFEAVEAERDALLKLIRVYEPEFSVSKITEPKNLPEAQRTSLSPIHEKIIDIAVRLSQQNGQPISNKMIGEKAVADGVFEGDYRDKKVLLSAILHAETKRSGARLRKIDRGMFEATK